PADRVSSCYLLGRELRAQGWGTRFDGEVTGVVGAGAFVRFGGELADVYEGFLPARTLRGERFDLNETETAIVGKRTGTAIRLGDPVALVVDSIEAARGRVDLLPQVGESSPRGPQRTRPPRRRPPKGSRASRVRSSRRRGR